MYDHAHVWNQTHTGVDGVDGESSPPMVEQHVLLPTQMVHSKGSATSGWRQTRIIGNSTIQLSKMRENFDF